MIRFFIACDDCGRPSPVPDETMYNRASLLHRLKVQQAGWRKVYRGRWDVDLCPECFGKVPGRKGIRVVRKR